MTSKTTKNTDFTNKIFNYFNLSRFLDKQAREEGLNHCPDDMLKSILDFTGDINQKGLGFYCIRLKIDYTRTYDNDLIDRKIKTAQDTIDFRRATNTENSYYLHSSQELLKMIKNYQDLKDNKEKRRTDRDFNIFYCEHCNKYYIGLNTLNKISNHFNTKSHRNNEKKKYTREEIIKREEKKEDKRIKKLIKDFYTTGIYTIENIEYKIDYYDEYMVRRDDYRFNQSKLEL